MIVVQEKRPHGRITGKHVAAIFVAFFGVVIAVNVIMARFATSTFGGIVVENTYVASQKYNDWLAEARAQEALGWSATPSWRPDGTVSIALEGAPAGASVEAIARHPLGRAPDQMLSFTPQGNGRHLSREALPDGRWTLRMIVTAGGKEWRKEAPIP